jgi:hypothetical protein
MYVLFFALGAIALAGLAFLADTRAQVSQQSTREMTAQTASVAEQGAQVFSACAQQTTPGPYTISSLITAGALPANYPLTTAYGNAWICEVATGGVNGGNVVIMAWDGAPQMAGALGAGSFTNTATQEQIAWSVAALVAQQISATNNADVGVVPANTTTMASESGASYGLTGLINAPTYSTPVVELGLASNSTS